MIASDILVEALSRGLPGDRLVVDPDVLAAISHDDAEWAPTGRAAVGVRARSEAEVQHVVRTCAELDAPIVPRGAGTGLSGGANAVGGCVILDLSPMNQILEIDQDNLLAVVQPGVINTDLKAAVAEHGLWYPPDPASALWSTIGGNVATNAGGLCCLKYGVTRDYVLGLRAVVGGPVGYGEAVRLGRRTTKGVAGLDLVGLFVGSEGTLGVVTEATLRLRPAPAGTPRTVVGAFADLVTPAGDDGARLEAQAAFEELLDAAIALGGTVTGEHGVGILKRDGMRRELDPGSLALQSAVRRALDPREIFNPGKG
jgi:glycolate oxidase